MTQLKRKSLIKVWIIPSLIILTLFVIFYQKILPAYANHASSQAAVLASVLNVREDADISSKIIGQAHRGETYEIIQTKNNWEQIKLSDNREGWVYKPYLASIENSQATVDAPVLNIRENPSLSSNVIGKLKLGAKITVHEEQGGWAKIVSSSGIQGWVYKDYITKNINSNQEAQPAEAQTSTDKTAVPESGSSSSKKNGKAFDADLGQQSLKGKTIVLDPGHGGVDVGTTSISGTHEKDLTLATVKTVANKLESAGANVMLTRTDDTYISLGQRTNLSNQNNTDAFLSFHYNWSNDPEINGLTDFYYTQSKDSSLASDLLNEVAKTTGLNNVGTKFDDLYVLRNNSKPSVLIELGFLSNKQDELAAESTSYNDHVAQGVYLGLLDYFSAKS